MIDLDCVYRPRSVALVGVTDRPDRPGSLLLANLVDKGFDGSVYPVARTAEQVDGRHCYRSVAELPEPVDLAYLLLPAAAAVEAAEQCAELGVRAAIVGASGFAEAGTDEGRALQKQLTRISESSGLRIVGPNCNGVYNAIDRIALGFNAAHSLDLPPGGLAVLSHSGALFSTMMLRAQRLRLGLAYFASVGNEVDLSVLDHLEYLLEQPATRVVGLVLDSLPDGARFARLARRAAERDVRLLALKLGSTETGAAVAVAHSSRLAGRHDAYRSLFSALGVGLVETVEQLMTAAAMLDRHVPVRPGARVGGLVMSGGAGALLADSAHRHGVPLATFTEPTRRALAAVATNAPPVNPVDTGITGGRTGVDELLALIGNDPDVDAVTAFYHPRVNPAGRAQLADQLVAGQVATGKPHILLAPVELTVEEQRRYASGGVLVVDDTDACFAALAAASAPPPSTVDIRRPPVGHGWVLDDVESLALLEQADLNVIETRVVPDLDAAVAAAEALGWPVVLKGTAAGIAHRSDLGLVAVGLVGADALRAAAARMAAAVPLIGFVVQPMITGAAEALVGLVTEHELGQFLVVGTGGVHTEAIADTALVPLGASPEAMRRALLGTALGRVLTSPRWRWPDTVDQVIDAMTGLADLARRQPIVAIDVNPLVLTPAGPIAVDALVVAGSDVEDQAGA